MIDGADAILPAGYDLLWGVGALVSLALFVAALLAWWRAPASGAMSQLLWFAVILCLPVLGPIIYLASEGSRPGSSVPGESRRHG
ncbi:PLDc N-terminal domain-containing protein [Demequina subtropica]|uniref:PLDc N-terminal domain-containing protein n=1 Tax=Demequina subtropica TaxID=1638989 RepID=UPI0007829964|nr:PLDc N-terminal domain-containing protein [Demequina subtropica]